MINITQEYLPNVVDYETANSIPKFQGAVNACTRFGLAAALKTMAERGGYIFDPSVRFMWWFTNKALLSVESSIQTLNYAGVCSEDKYPWIVENDYPYNVLDLNTPPSLAALAESDIIQYNVKVERLGGKEEVKRALAQGYSLITCRVQGPSIEHVEACIGYDEIKGMKIYGSGLSIYYEPWESLLNGVMTQVWKLYNTPWPVVPHPDYVEGTIPYLAGNMLVIPKVRVYVGWPEPSLNFKNVVFDLSSRGTIIEDSTDVASEVIWHSPSFSLRVPKIIIDGELKHKVKLVNPVATLVQVEEA